MSEQAFRFWQVGLLALNALLLWIYVTSTRRIEKAAIQQAKTSARQADISAQQANIQWWLWPEESDGPGSLQAPHGRLGFIAAGAAEALPEGPLALQHPSRKIWCRYSSVSGSMYRSECFLKSDTMIKVWHEVKFYPEPPIT
jgi:hypothetical protein